MLLSSSQMEGLHQHKPYQAQHSSNGGIVSEHYDPKRFEYAHVQYQSEKCTIFTLKKMLVVVTLSLSSGTGELEPGRPWWWTY